MHRPIHSCAASLPRTVFTVCSDTDALSRSKSSLCVGVKSWKFMFFQLQNSNRAVLQRLLLPRNSRSLISCFPQNIWSASSDRCEYKGPVAQSSSTVADFEERSLARAQRLGPQVQCGESSQVYLRLRRSKVPLKHCYHSLFRESLASSGL